MPTSPKKTVTIPMTKTKETKGTWHYAADDDTAIASNIYVSKVGLDKIENAEKIEVTITKVS
jgi:hypothetical protein